MEVNMDVCFTNMETENMELNDSLRDLEAENHHLIEKVSLLEKALEREKKFHRKYADEVSATEAIRNEDFKKAKRAIVEENKSMVKVNRQLTKDVEFYKKAHEELAKESESTVGMMSNSSENIRAYSSELNSAECTTSRTAYKLRSPSKSVSQTQSYRLPPSECTNISSKVLTKINKTLFEENKKLKLKISDIRAIVVALKKKVKQLENFRNKIDNKKSKYCRDSEELERLVASSQKKNKDKYTAEVLAMLGNLPNKKK